MNRLLLKYIVLAILTGYFKVAFAAQCPAKIQLTHFTPSICYYSIAHGDCADQCRTALPGANPACFTELSLPCDTRDALFASAPSRQQQDSHTWVHISDLLNFPPLRSDLHIIRQDLYQDLYRDYVSPPSLEGFSAASQQLKKENFRLLLISEIKTIVAPLKEAAVFKRLALGISLEPSIQKEYTDIIRRINDYPLFNATEKNTLISELNQIKQNELVLWHFIRHANPALVKGSRVDYLNNQLRQLAQNLGKLSDTKREFSLSKTQSLNSLAAFNFRNCVTGVCFDPIMTGDEDYYQGMDQEHTHMEVFLNHSLQETAVLEHTVGVNPTPGDFPHPDFSGLMNSHINAYRADPSVDNLKRLEVAINIAFLQQDVDGLTLFDELKSTATAQLQGQGFFSHYENKKVLLCRELDDINVRLKEIQTEVFTVSNDAHAIIRQMLEQGHSEQLLAQLNLLLTRLTDLAAESQQLSSIDRFSSDRYVNILWNLNARNDQFDSTGGDVRIEFVAFDGMYWIPSVSTPLMRLIPTISDISTIKGSLLPSGNGRMAALNTLSLTLRQSPYINCSTANKQIKMVVNVVRDNGVSNRYSLEADLNQL